MTTLRANLLDKVIADLRGTCQILEDVVEYWKTGELSIEDLEYIESEIFLCNGCGWWCERCDEVEDNLCQDCYEEELED